MSSLANACNSDALRSNFVAVDTRADGAERHIEVGRERISIARRFMGIEMHVAVPTMTYEAVVLHQEPHQGSCEITLQHQDPELSIALWQEGDDPALLESVWQSWAAYLQLPAVRESGDCKGAAPRNGANERRHRGVDAARRPRFLGRRKPGCVDRLATVHHDEELISYE